MKTTKVRLRIKKAISYILMILSGLLIAILIYIRTNYKDVTFEQLLYTLIYNEGTSFNAVSKGVIYCILAVIFFSIISLVPWFIKSKTRNFINLSVGNKKYNFQVFPLKRKYILKYYSIIFLICLIIFCI